MECGSTPAWLVLGQHVGAVVKRPNGEASGTFRGIVSVAQPMGGPTFQQRLSPRRVGGTSPAARGLSGAGWILWDTNGARVAADASEKRLN